MSQVNITLNTNTVDINTTNISVEECITKIKSYVG